MSTLPCSLTPTTPRKEVDALANDEDYKRAAQAVQSGDATPEQLELNNRMARNTRAGSTLAQNAQDAKVGKLKKS